MTLTPIKKPNFFILGAAKSGSTSLYHYLRQHPAVFMPDKIKEPSFFCDTYDMQDVKDPIKYFELFDPAGPEKKLLGEASHVYLTNPSTARVLKGLFPDAKFIIILRNPADRAYSLYQDMRRQGWEKISTFEKALRAEDERAASRRFRKRCSHYISNYLYFRSGLYGEQIERYLSVFDRKQFHILSLHKLQSDPLGSIRDICKFLGIDTDFTPEVKIHNEGLLTARVPLMLYLWRKKLRRPRPLRRLVLRILQNLNTMPVPPINPDTRKDLLARYENDLKLLYELTGIRFVTD